MKYLITILLMAVLSGCLGPLRLTVDDYMVVYQSVELGMSKREVQEILAPSQSRLSSTYIKQSDKYMKDGVAVDILYFRSGWQSDGINTDDEYTPYLFNDDKLVAIGWHILGGARSLGQATDDVLYRQLF